MICRVWHGWTSEENAAAYSEFLLLDLFPRVKEQLRSAGFRGYDLMQKRREIDRDLKSIRPRAA